MFERNKICAEEQQRTVAVEMKLTGNQSLIGRIAIPRSKSMAEALNGTGGFIEFEDFDGRRQFIAKSHLISLQPVEIATEKPLRAGPSGGDAFDPYAVLGVTRGCAAEDLRKAYHKLSMTYHPDRYASAGLPAEVQDYLQSMARRINTAYSLLQAESARAQQQTTTAARSAPIYESRRPA